MTFENYNPQLDQYETLEVDYQITGGEPERRSGHPDNWSPAEDPDFEMSVYNEAGIEITTELESNILEAIESECWKEQKQFEKDFKNGLYV